MKLKKILIVLFIIFIPLTFILIIRIFKVENVLNDKEINKNLFKIDCY